jgi:UDP-N-acetylmuramoylalanine--D-glutamate ligase
LEIVFSLIKNKIQNKKILILGFGKEGRASLKFLMKYFKGNEVAVADSNADLRYNIDEKLLKDTDFYFGDSYLKEIDNYDLIIKSPGIPASLLNGKVSSKKITSQTDLFLTQFRDRIVGVTGTKGKSTTSSLIYFILMNKFENVHLVGNIGIPPFDLIEEIKDDSKIVFEMSSHQLENITVSPHISVLLNLFEEHLDHYNGLAEYHSAKLNIMRFQKAGDIFIYNADDPVIRNALKRTQTKGTFFPYSVSNDFEEGIFYKSGKIFIVQDNITSEFDFSNRQNLPGSHNLFNIMASVAVAKILRLDDPVIQEVVQHFKGLPHRLEYIGEFNEIHFYNDSIATIPEATIEAVKTLKSVDTLILGGKDRGIDYSNLIEFVIDSDLKNVVFIGDAGKRIYDGIIEKGGANDTYLFFIEEFDEISEIIRQNTQNGSICLLSPAAPSYDKFRNFEERGAAFKKIAENL